MLSQCYWLDDETLMLVEQMQVTRIFVQGGILCFIAAAVQSHHGVAHFQCVCGVRCIKMRTIDVYYSLSCIYVYLFARKCVASFAR